ncbi:hypothetical protein D3C84_912550 [compost metagenome]
MGDLEQCQRGLFFIFHPFRQLHWHRIEACFHGRAHATVKTIFQHVHQCEHALDATDADAFLWGFTRHESQQILAPDRLAAQVRSQVHHRTVAAGAGDQVTVEPLAGAGNAQGFDIDGRNACRRYSLAAARFNNGT